MIRHVHFLLFRQSFIFVTYGSLICVNLSLLSIIDNKAVKGDTLMFLVFELIRHMTVKQACENIIGSPRRRVSNLRVLDLLFDRVGNVPGQYGVYIFFSEAGECLYVGKNSNQTYLEWIPRHFSSNANNLLKRLRKGYNVQSLEECVRMASSFELLLIPVPVWDIIKPLESLLRKSMHPKLNGLQEWNEWDSDRPIEDFLK